MPLQISSVAHQSCRTSNSGFLSQLAKCVDGALQGEPLRVETNSRSRTIRRTRQCGASQQKGERITWKLGGSRGGILRNADPRLRVNGGSDQSSAQNEIVDAARRYHLIGRKLQLAPSSLCPGGASAPTRSAVAHRNPSPRQTGPLGELEA